MKHTFEATDTDLVRTGFEHLYEVYEKIDLELSKQVQRLVMVDFPRALPTQTLTWS